MKVPTCKLCQKAHWSYEDHAGMEPSVPGYVREMAKGALGISAAPMPETVVKHPVVGSRVNNRTEMNNRTNKRTRGRPKKWASEAERLRAYRERQSA